MVEERGKEEMIKRIQGASSLVLMAASKSTNLSESTNMLESNESLGKESFDPSEILLSHQFDEG